MDSLSKLRSSLAERYDIEREIGAGGMATVYLAKDQRHDRNVALKVLNPELGAVLGVERFLSEIKVTANLQHPNLLPLFDSGEADGLLFYVMPFVEGESLRARLDREKQLPIDEAIRIAVAVANALDYAHSHHVIHRDLKPENILLQHGQPVVADFGIALAVSKAGGNRVTQTGLSLGTPQYMSPEQATGDRVIDGRTDIYSLGALTYEMLSGEPPHIGHTSQAIIARLLTDRPRSVRSSRPAVAEHVDAAVQRALEKLPADRFSTAKEFADALQGRGGFTTTSSTSPAPVVARSSGIQARLRDPVTVALAVVAILAIGAAAVAMNRSPAGSPVPTTRFVMAMPDSVKPIDNYPWPAAISPDGRVVIFAVGQRTGDPMLYALRTDQLEPRPIAGTAGAFSPHFSPDGKWLAFQANGKEKKVRLDGSAPVTIADGGSANGATWTIHDELVVGASLTFNGLSRVNAAGGELAEFTHPDTATGVRQHVWPIATPDGEHVVFTLWSGSLASSQLAIAPIDDGDVTSLGVKGIRPLGVLDGQLVFLQADGTVMAVALDVGGAKITGRPVPVLDPVPVVGGNNGNSGIFLSAAGALITSRGGTQSQLVWAADESARPIVPQPRGFFSPRLSPDERRIAVGVTEGQKSDVWVYDMATTTFSRLSTVATASSVEWTADGSSIVFAAAGETTRFGFWRQRASGGTQAEKLFETNDLAPTVVMSPDQKSLVYQAYDNNSWNLYRVTLDSARQAAPYLTMRNVNEMTPRFSPDGKWVALQADESGQMEVYVRSFPEPSSRVQVSVDGGLQPSWSKDGRSLYYRVGRSLLVARIELSPSFRVLGRDTVSTVAMAPFLGFGSDYDVQRDGKRMVTLISNRDDYQLVVAPNWITEFREKVAGSERARR